MTQREELDRLFKAFREDAPRSLIKFTVALLVWLLWVLIYLPISNTIDASGNTPFTLGLIVLSAFSILIYDGLKRYSSTIELLSSLLAKKYGGLEQGYESSKLLFKNMIRVISSIVLAVLYWPILSPIHPALYGIFLFTMILWIIYLLIKISSILYSLILSWITKTNEELNGGERRMRISL